MTLDELARNPELAAQLPREALRALYRQAARAEADLRARLLAGLGEGAAAGADTGEQLLKLPEVAAVLAVPVSEAYALARRGQLPTVRIGPKYVRVRRADLEAWVRARRDAPLDPWYSGARGDDRRSVPAAQAAARPHAGGPRRPTGRLRERRGAVGTGRAADLGAGGQLPPAPDRDRETP